MKPFERSTPGRSGSRAERTCSPLNRFLAAIGARRWQFAASLPPLTLVTVGILLTAANLRPSMLGVGPLLKEIEVDTGLSQALLGLLVTVPVIAFALVSPIAAPLARRFGLERMLLASLALLASGVVLRSLPGTTTLFGGAALLGTGIAFGNVLVPALIRRDFGRHIGAMTSVFVTLLAGVGAVGAGVAVPAAELLGWRGALALWAVPAILGAIWWGFALGRSAGPPSSSAPVGMPDAAPAAAVWRSLLAWQVTAFMGLQSLSFYVLVAWLPSLLQGQGLSAATAGTYAFVFQLACLTGSMLAPLWASRAKDQWLHALVASILILVCYLGLFVAAAWVGWVVIGGLGCGASLALSMAFFSLRSHNPLQTAALSGMAQSIGYGLAALGPLLFGLLRDSTGSWQLPLVMMWGLVVLQCWVGILAGRARRL